MNPRANTPREPPPLALVIFGAHGDLTRRLVVPALYNLSGAGLLPRHMALVGVDHNGKSAEEWSGELLDFMEKAAKSGTQEFDARGIEREAWQRLSSAMSYVTADFDDASAFARLGSHLAECDRRLRLEGNVVFYLAVPERFFGPIVEQLGKQKLLEERSGFRRVVIEKPFGHDLASACALNAQIHQYLREEQIYRIDHFLGKETVQNIMALRFANGLFEPIWNRDRIDHVQITVAEDIGIGTRGNFYEQTGALRDMVPNHLFQLVAMTAMEPPSSFDADAVRDQKANVFRSMQPVAPGDAVRGQYGAGITGNKRVCGYREEANVDPNSIVETFAALRLCIDNWRWAGVPFYIRTGKHMPKRSTQIAVRFKPAPLKLFEKTPVDEMHGNWVVLQIQPSEGIHVHFNAKIPGPEMALDGVRMDFCYKDWFRQTQAVGYETLLYDCFIGDATLFQRADQVEAAWAIVEPLLAAWKEAPEEPFPNYATGTTGPEAADALLARDGRRWRPIP